MSATIDPALLEACAREPIHIPGYIQPYGVLLVVEPEDGRIVQASANAGELLGVASAQLLGMRYDQVLALPEAARPQAVAETVHLLPADLAFPARAQPPARPWLATWHLYPQQWLLELEPRDAALVDVSLREAMPLLRRLEQMRDLNEACQRTAVGLRSLTGFDRVMVYRFDEEWNGDVVAEARVPELESFLGLHYPASDIPAQARALYLRNRVRQIADVNYLPSPIEPAAHPRLGTPVDLSDVSLRSVSPVHLEYLQNMGVAATLVASIVVNDALWGLISCHHYSPMFCSHDMRDATDAVARTLGSRIGALQALAQARAESLLLTVREKLITDFNAAESVTTDLLAGMATELVDVVDADGVAVFHGDQISRYGQLPDNASLRRIRSAVEAYQREQPQDEGSAGVFHVDALGSVMPELADLNPQAAGLIFVPLAADARSVLMWTRREQVHTVNWAGNPHLSKLQEAPGARLSPRKSFALWQESVHGRAHPWSAPNLEAARSLRVLVELMERRRFQQDFSLLEASLSRLQQGVAILERVQDAKLARLSFANEAFAQDAGREIAEIIGEDLHSLLAEQADEQRVRELADALRKSRPVYMTLPLQVRDGDARYRQFDLEPLPNAGGQSTHWLLQLRNPGVAR